LRFAAKQMSMPTQRQQQIINEIIQGLSTSLESKSRLKIIQTPGYIDSPIEIDDFATSAMAVLGMLTAKVAETRGLESQEITIDRRHAGLMLNSIAYHFQNGWQFDIGPVHSPINNFFKTKDGRWIFFNGAYQHLRDGLLNLLDVPNNHDSIAAATKKHNAFELEDRIAEQGFCATVVRTKEDWLAHEHGKTISNQPVIELIKIANADKTPLSDNVNRPLEKIKVLDFTKVVAGPTLTRQLADQGADVIHCRHPYQDHIPAFELESSYGKKNIYLDYKKSQDKDLLCRLLENADVFVEGYRTGAIEKAGFGIKDIIKIKKNLIYVQLNGYGFDGPWTERRGWEQLAQATTGLAYIHSGSADKKPQLIPAYFSDYMTGYLGAIGVLAALLKRHEEGGSWLVRVALAKTAMLATTYTSGNGDTKDITETDLQKYLIDQDSSVGLLTRVAPPIQFSKYPSQSLPAPTYPGTHTLGIDWEQDHTKSLTIPHRPTEIFKTREVHYKTKQVL